MNDYDFTDLERELGAALRELAPTPRAGSLARAMSRVADTPQRTGRLGALESDTGSTRRGQGIRRWQVAAAALVGVVAGIAVGLAAGGMLAERGPAVGQSSASPNATTSPSPSEVPSSGTPEPSSVPPAPHDPDATWDRHDLRDPAPGVFGGGFPSEVVAYGGGYVVVGSAQGSCASDIHQPPPDCDESQSALTGDPIHQAAAVWTSSDGRKWELIESDAFARGRMQHVASDGHLLVASGERSRSPVELGASLEPALWRSSDGRSWELVETDGPIPEHLTRTSAGWIGARNSDGGPEFLVSADGLDWTVTSPAGTLGEGHVADLVAAVDGGGALAVGYDEVLNPEHLLDSSSAAAWQTSDGSTWTRAAGQGAFVSGSPNYTWMFAAAAIPDGWVAVGRAADWGEHDTAVWKSSDGANWERIPAAASPAGDATLDSVTWTDPGLIVGGTLSSATGSAAALWVSADGTSWDPVRRREAFEDGSIRDTVASGSVVLAIGTYPSGPDHWTPAVWRSTR